MTDKKLKHLAVIMDGNGRWAQRRGLPRTLGHRAGVESLHRIVELCPKYAVEYLTVYAFSTENWRRPKLEVKGLMSLLDEYMDKELNQLHKNGVVLRVLGDLGPMADALSKKIESGVALTQNNQGLVLSLALNYGGRNELLQSAKALAYRALAGEDPANWNEDDFAAELYTKGLPDPDFLVRTGGDLRVSNFLLWQIAYTEFWSTPVLWPDFNEDNLIEAFAEYSKRQRRFGGV